MCNIVFENSGDIFLIRSQYDTWETKKTTHLRKVALAIADQQTSFSAATITHDNEFFRERWWKRDVCSGRQPPYGPSRSCADRAIACPRALISDRFSPRGNRSIPSTIPLAHHSAAAP